MFLPTPGNSNTRIVKNIIMDITIEHGDYFKDKMYFAPEDIFKTQFQAVIDRELKLTFIL